MKLAVGMHEFWEVNSNVVCSCDDNECECSSVHDDGTEEMSIIGTLR